MSRLSPRSISLLLPEVYAKANTCHNNLELDADLFTSHLLAILDKHKQSLTIHLAPVDWLRKLHTNDLYLALACAQSSDTAWERLDRLYHGYMRKVASAICGNRQQAEEMVQDTLTHLFLTDKTGKRRIASYQGLSPLTNWLATVMKHQAIEEWKVLSQQVQSLDTVLDMPEEISLQRIESATKGNKYSWMVNDALGRACRVLTDRDRWFLILRYEEVSPIKKIAEKANLDPTTVAYHIKQAQEKLRKEIYSIFKTEYKLNELALKECIEEILTNPAYSLLPLLKPYECKGTGEPGKEPGLPEEPGKQLCVLLRRYL